MLIICNDLTTNNPEVKKAIDNKDAGPIKDIVAQAKENGYNALELDATSSDNEPEALLFILNQIEDTDLTLVLRINDTSVYEKVIPQMKCSGIVNPVDITLKQAEVVFPMLKKLDDDWKVLFTQDYGEDTVSNEIEGSKQVISKAEQEGILPERIYVEPLTEPIKTNNNCYINFYISKKLKQ